MNYDTFPDEYQAPDENATMTVIVVDPSAALAELGRYAEAETDAA